MRTKIFKFKKLTFLLLIIFFTVHFKFFENTYIILKSDYDQRLTQIMVIVKKILMDL